MPHELGVARRAPRIASTASSSQAPIRAGRVARPSRTRGAGRVDRWPARAAATAARRTDAGPPAPCRPAPDRDPRPAPPPGRRAPPRRERIGLPVAAVQRQHQPDPPALVQRVPGNPRLQLRHQLAVPAEVEVDVDPSLEDRRLHVCQALPLAVRPAGRPPVLEGFATPVRQGGLELASRGQQIAGGVGGAARRRRHRGRARVDRLRVHRQRVRVSPPADQLSRRTRRTLRFEAGPQPDHVRLQRPAGRRRWPARPDVVDENVHRHRPARTDQQPAEHSAFLLAPGTATPVGGSPTSTTRGPRTRRNTYSA